MSSASPPPSCVICGKPVDPTYSPFCSKRCADVDLQRWLTGSYVIPGGDDEEPDETPHDTGEEG